MLKKLIILGLVISVLILFAVPVFANDTVTEEEKEEYKANFVVPPVDELFTALDSLGKINWEEQLNKIQTAGRDKFDYKTDEALALNLGIRVADTTVAIKVKDKKAVGELVANAEQLANKLNVSTSILEKSKEIKQAVKQEQWEKVLLSINGLEDDITLELALRADSDLSVLTTLAGWIEGVNIITGSLSKKYEAPAATVLRQPGLISFYQKKLNAMNEDTKKLPIIQRVVNLVEQLQVLCDVPEGKAVPKENVDKISALVSDLVNDITKLD